MIIWYIASVLHTVLQNNSAIFSEKVCLQLPASPPHFAPFFETNAIDQ